MIILCIISHKIVLLYYTLLRDAFYAIDVRLGYTSYLIERCDDDDDDDDDDHHNNNTTTI